MRALRWFMIWPSKSPTQPGTVRTSFGLAKADDGIQNWDLGIQPVNNGSNLDLYRRHSRRLQSQQRRL